MESKEELKEYYEKKQYSFFILGIIFIILAVFIIIVNEYYFQGEKVGLKIMVAVSLIVSMMFAFEVDRLWRFITLIDYLEKNKER